MRLSSLIHALKCKTDSDGELQFDRDQTLYLMFFLYALEELEPDFRDGISYKYALLDFLGVLPNEREESA